ncbi:hypothetical protein D3C80_1805040 [compost metagenome]
MAPLLEFDQPGDHSLCDTDQHQVVAGHAFGKRLRRSYLGEGFHPLCRQRGRNGLGECTQAEGAGVGQVIVGQLAYLHGRLPCLVETG